MNIYVNGRFRSQKVTGVQRVAHEITRRLGNEVETFEPKRRLCGWQGHLWEQTTLPRQCRSGVLWNPCASGPVRGVRHVATIHDLFPVDSPGWYQKTYASWHALTLRRLASSAAHIIAVSEYTKWRIMARFGIAEEKISVVYNGVDASWFHTPPDGAARARHALQLPGKRYLLTLGSLEPRKNLRTLLAAWQEGLASLPDDLWLVVSGSGDSAVYRNAGIAELPARVFLAGYVPDEFLPGLYAGSMGFVYPSLAEGFGLPPLEAMACGTPVVTSNAAALPEVCSSAAIYFDPTDAGDLLRAMHLLVSDAHLRETLAERGRQQAARFNWERTAEQTLQVLRTIASSAH